MNYTHRPGLYVKARFSEDRQFRYALSIKKNPLKRGRTVCVIMQNPSDADDARADKSVQFLEKLIFEKQHPIFRNVNQMCIVNQFAFVQKKGFKGSDKLVGPENDKVLKMYIHRSDIVLVAWGKNNPYTSRKKFILDLIAGSGPKTLLKTKKHPSRGSYTDFLEPLTV